MARLEFAFDREAAMAALAYLQQKLPGLTRHQAFKLLYLADLLHLERYGRPITGDTYVAMEYGPVPSQLYDLVKRHLSAGPSLPKIEADLEELSRSDLRILDEVVDRYGRYTFAERTELTHDEAWRQARDQHPGHKAPPIPWETIIRANLDHADELLRFLMDV